MIVLTDNTLKMNDEELNLIQFKSSWNDVRLYDAARCGHLRVLEWARNTNFQKLRQLGPALCNTAASYGQIAVLEWLKANRIEWNHVTCAFAAENGRLDTLVWLRERKCPWDELTCQWAKEKGHTDVLRWARENGAP